MFRKLLMWLGYEPTWFTLLEFDRKVGRFPCVACIQANRGEKFLVLCDHDLDAWFDAVVA